MKTGADGMVVSVELAPIDNTLADAGKKEFNKQCVTCHKMDKRLIGPPLDGITVRRTPEWIMNMMLYTGRMLREDPVAIELLKEYKIQMTQANVKPQKARAILEYLRQNDVKFK
jgi:mono/diheme cytochrome c family protein